MSANHILQNFLSVENFPEWKFAFILDIFILDQFPQLFIVRFHNWPLGMHRI